MDLDDMVDLTEEYKDSLYEELGSDYVQETPVKE